MLLTWKCKTNSVSSPSNCRKALHFCSSSTSSQQMVRGGKVDSKRNSKRRVNRNEDSDESDEDYVVSDVQSDASDDVLHDLVGSASDSSSGELNDKVNEQDIDDNDADADNEGVEEEGDGDDEYEGVEEEVDGDDDYEGVEDGDGDGDGGVEEEEEEEEEEECDDEDGGTDGNDVVKSKGRSCSFDQKREGGKTSQKRSRVTLLEQEEEEEDDDEDYEANGDDEDDVVKSEVRQFSFGQETEGGKTSRRRSRVTLQEQEEEEGDDEDYEANGDDDDEDDEEFTPDEDDCLDEEEDSASKKRNRGKVDAHKNTRKGKQASSKQRKSRKSSVPRGKQGRKIRRPKKKPRFSDGSEDDDEDGNFVTRNTVWTRKNKKNLRRRKRSYSAESDPDFMTSGSSDFEYTISEEEREQVREAGTFCRNLMGIQEMKTSSSKRPKQDRPLRLRSAAFSRKTEVENCTHHQRTATCVKGKEKADEENAKQLCGICFSEEDKKRVRGKLDSCSHYFCFNCIMEWSKVETRCPLCKQRFKTISKPGRLSAGIDLRDVVIQVRERDQVYQPTEEEIRGYLDPYENVICTECHQGGDDELMLLCDLCNSPAHTFCVSLGREVPEGNWYCNGCRPGVLGSSSTHSQDNSLSDQRANNINLSGRIISSTFGGEGLDLNVAPTPIPSLVTTQGVAGNYYLASPRFSGVMSPLSGAGTPTLSGRRWIQSHIQRLLSFSRLNPPRGAERADGVVSSSSTLGGAETQARIDPETRVNSFTNLLGERLLQGSSIPSSLSLRSRGDRQNHLRTPDQGIENSSSSVVTPPARGDPLLESSSNNLYRAKEQLQCIVRSHLTRLSGGIHLGEGEMKEIVRSATNTILVACGGKTEEVDTVIPFPPPPTFCQHIDGILSGRTSPMPNVCAACFDGFTRDVVQSVMNSKLPHNHNHNHNHWLSLGI